MIGIGTISALLMAAKLALGEDAWNSLFPARVVLPGTLSVGLIVSLFIVNSARNARLRRRALIAQVADQQDQFNTRSIGPLIDALYLDDAKTREIAIAALTEILPTLKASDTALLNESQRARLCYLISVSVDNPLHKDVRALFRPADTRAIAFRVAILQAFEQVGDSNALAVVERLARGETKTAGESLIREAALACLPALQMRTQCEDRSRTLLRAAGAEANHEVALLRPVDGQHEVEPEKLLRSSQQDT